MKTRQAPCPRCGKPATLFSDNPWRPFCTERCKLIDLGEWAAERYSIPDDETPEAGTAEDALHRQKH